MSIAVLRGNETICSSEEVRVQGRKEGKGREEGRRREGGGKKEGGKEGRKDPRKGGAEERGRTWGGWGHQAKSPLLSRMLGGSDPSSYLRHQIMTLPLLGFARSRHQK